MKKYLMLMLTAVVVSSCALKSYTFIGPKKEFELGDGKHGPFKAAVKNNSQAIIEVYKLPLNGNMEKIATLNPGDNVTAAFAANTKAIFKNVTDGQASLVIKVTGTTSLSMGGPNYK